MIKPNFSFTAEDIKRDLSFIPYKSAEEIIEKLKKGFERRADHISHDAHDFLASLDKNQDFHGVEWVADSVCYLNTGDPYSSTFLYNSEKGEVWIGSWADYLERQIIKKGYTFEDSMEYH